MMPIMPGPVRINPLPWNSKQTNKGVLFFKIVANNQADKPLPDGAYSKQTNKSGFNFLFI